MTSSFRRLDLVTKLLAPVVTGQIMTFAGLKIGCGFVAGWSLISLFIEYYLIKRVYNIVPALKTTKLAGNFEGMYLQYWICTNIILVNPSVNNWINSVYCYFS